MIEVLFLSVSTANCQHTFSRSLSLSRSWKDLSKGGGNVSSESFFIHVLPVAFTFEVSSR